MNDSVVICFAGDRIAANHKAQIEHTLSGHTYSAAQPRPAHLGFSDVGTAGADTSDARSGERRTPVRRSSCGHMLPLVAAGLPPAPLRTRAAHPAREGHTS